MKLSIRLVLLFAVPFFSRLVASKETVTARQDEIVTFDCDRKNDECCSDADEWKEIRNRGDLDDQTIKNGRFCSKVGKFDKCRGLNRQDCEVKCDNDCKINVELDVPPNVNNRNRNRVTDAKCLQIAKRNCPCTNSSNRNRRCPRRVVNKRCDDLSSRERRRVIDRFENTCDNRFKRN